MKKTVTALWPSKSRSGEEDLFSAARFVDELGKFWGLKVDCREDGPDGDDGEGFLLSFSSEPPGWVLSLETGRRRRTLERVVLLRCRRAPTMLEDLDRWGVAAGVEALTYGLWEDGKSTGYGIAGLHQAVEIIGGECAPAPFTTARYCMYESPNSHRLTQALAEYLDALDRSKATVV